MRGLIWAFLTPLVAIVHAEMPMAGADKVVKLTESVELGNGIRSLKWDDARGGLAIELWTVQDNLHSVELSFGDDNMNPVCSCPVVVLCAPTRAALKDAAESDDESTGESPSFAARPALTTSPTGSTPATKTPASTPALSSSSSSALSSSSPSSSSSTITHLATNTTTPPTDRSRWPSCGVPGQKTQDMGSGKAMVDSKTWTPLSVSHGELGAPSPLVVEVLLPRENLETCGVTNKARGLSHQQQQQQQHRQQETKKDAAVSDTPNDLSHDKTYAKSNNPCLFTGMLCTQFRYAPVVDGGYCTTTMQSCHMITVHVPPPTVRGPIGTLGSSNSSASGHGNPTSTAASNRTTTVGSGNRDTTTASIAHRVLLRGSSA